MNLIDLTNKMIPEKKIPKIKTGDIVRVTQTLSKGEGIQHQVFEGVVLSVKGSGFNKTVLIRKISAGVGVEKVFPLYSPTISKIEIKKSSKVKRAKLYWLRERAGKSARLTEKAIDPEVIKLMEEESAPKTAPEKVENQSQADDKAKAEKKEVKDEKKDKSSSGENNKEKSNSKK